jgi:hypothetical protein
VAASRNDEDVSRYVDTTLVTGADLGSCKTAIRKLSSLPSCSASAPYQLPNGKIRLAWVCSGWVDYNMLFVVDDVRGKITRVYGSARTPPPTLSPGWKKKPERG